MATEIEYVNYKDFVAGLETTENPGVDDVTVVSNETDGPRAVPANTSALSNTATDSDLTAAASFELQTATGKKQVPADLLAKQTGLETTNGNVTNLQSAVTGLQIKMGFMEPAIEYGAVKYDDVKGEMLVGYGINTSDEIGTTISLEPYSLSATSCIVINCRKKDVFKIKGHSLSNIRLWAFVDSDNKIVSHSDANATLSEVTPVVAPVDGKCIINFYGTNEQQDTYYLGKPSYALDLVAKCITDASPFETKTFDYVNGYYLSPDNVGDVVRPTDYKSYTSKCGYMSVSQGDVLRIKGHAGVRTLLWLFVDSDFEYVSGSDSNRFYSSYIEVTVPVDGYVYVNDFGNQTGEFGAEVKKNIHSALKFIDESIRGDLSPDVISLDADLSKTLTLTKDTIIEGNGHAIDLTEVLDLDFTDDIAEIAHDASANSLIYRVFVSQELPPTNENVSNPYNHVTIWADDETLSECVNLSPKLTVEEVEATDNSFTYDGTKFIIHCSSHATKTFRLLPDSGYCINAVGCKVVVRNLKCIGGWNNCIRITNCQYELSNCVACFSKIGSAISLLGSYGTCKNCVSHHACVDGYGVNDGGNNELICCKGLYNGDDGVSHHSDTGKGRFLIDGGEWAYNEKAGIASPVYSSHGEIQGAYIHHNHHGVYAVDSDSHPAVTSIVNICNNVFESNDRVATVKGYNLLMFNNVFKNNVAEFFVNALSGSIKDYNNIRLTE